MMKDTKEKTLMGRSKQNIKGNDFFINLFTYQNVDYQFNSECMKHI